MYVCRHDTLCSLHFSFFLFLTKLDFLIVLSQTCLFSVLVSFSVYIVLKRLLTVMKGNITLLLYCRDLEV